MQRPDPTATVAEVLKAITPVLAPVMERLATAPQPTSAPTLGPTDLLNLAERIKGLIGTPEMNLRREIREAFREGLEIGRERAFAAGGEGGESWGETIRSLVQGFSPLLPGLVQAAQRAQPGVGGGQQALPGEQPQGGDGGGTMPTNPVFVEILDALLEELRRPDHDLPGITAFLESLVLNEQGETLRDRLDAIARSPERLAQLSVKLIDPRLIAPDVWPGVRDLLAYIKQQTELENAKGDEAL
ncbi:MAG: hypothetical protein ACE5JI_19080 [Acidobacteriota bacterium]